MTNHKKKDDKPDIVFDREGFIRRLLGDEELARDILKKFIVEISHHINSLKKFGRNKKNDSEDAAKAATILHTMKGSCVTTGALAMRDVVQKLEYEAKAGNITKMLQLLPLLEKQLEIFKKASDSE